MPLTIFSKRSILSAWQGSEYAFVKFIWKTQKDKLAES